MYYSEGESTTRRLRQPKKALLQIIPQWGTMAEAITSNSPHYFSKGGHDTYFFQPLQVSAVLSASNVTAALL
jgi:hypothetical protein